MKRMKSISERIYDEDYVGKIHVDSAGIRLRLTWDAEGESIDLDVDQVRKLRLACLHFERSQLP